MFYQACCDRIHLIITERDAGVSPDQFLKILKTLSHFRPKDQSEEEDYDMGGGKGIQEISGPFELGQFFATNLGKILNQEKENDQEQGSQIELYDVLEVYQQLYQSLEMRINDLIN